MTITNSILVCIVGYFCGCIQTAYFLGKFVKKMDIRQQGSGNAGASNVTMVLGWRYGIITALVDVLKGVIPVLVAKALYPSVPSLAFLAGLSAIVGHIFPFYLRFRGGKGVATLLGMLLGYEVRWGVIFTALMVILALTFDYIVAGSLTVFTGLPIFAITLKLPLLMVLFSVILSVIAYIKHWENIQRIRSGTEVRISDTMRKK